MATDRYSNIGRNGVVKEGIFVRFPDLIPASTDNYSNSEFLVEFNCFFNFKFYICNIYS
jgi:hypothetical protein